jgi:hypothetical protein
MCNISVFTCVAATQSLLCFILRINKKFRAAKLRVVKLSCGTSIYSGFNGAALEDQQQDFQ